MQIWRDEPDSDCDWTNPETERWYGIGERGGQSWAVPEAVAVKLMQMGAEAQRAASFVTEDWRGMTHPLVGFRDIDPVAELKRLTEQ